MAIIGVDVLMKKFGGKEHFSVDNSSDLMESLIPLKGGVAMYDLVDSINQDRDIKNIFITSIFDDRNVIINRLKVRHGFDLSHKNAIYACYEMITKVVTNFLFSKKSASDISSESFLEVADDIWSSLGGASVLCNYDEFKRAFSSDDVLSLLKGLMRRSTDEDDCLPKEMFFACYNTSSKRVEYGLCSKKLNDIYYESPDIVEQELSCMSLFMYDLIRLIVQDGHMNDSLRNMPIEEVIKKIKTYFYGSISNNMSYYFDRKFGTTYNKGKVNTDLCSQVMSCLLRKSNEQINRLIKGVSLADLGSSSNGFFPQDGDSFLSIHAQFECDSTGGPKGIGHPILNRKKNINLGKLSEWYRSFYGDDNGVYSVIYEVNGEKFFIENPLFFMPASGYVKLRKMNSYDENSYNIGTTINYKVWR